MDLEKLLRKLPPGRFLRLGVVLDMDNRERNCLFWAYNDGINYRVSAFAIDDGEYLGEWQ